jgi:hypothetical protein
LPCGRCAGLFPWDRRSFFHAGAGVSAALKRQAFAPLPDLGRQAQEEAPHYFPHKDQMVLGLAEPGQAELFDLFAPVAHGDISASVTEIREHDAAESATVATLSERRSFRAEEGAKVSPPAGGEVSALRPSAGGESFHPSRVQPAAKALPAAIDDKPVSLSHLTLVVFETIHETYGGLKSGQKELAADAGTTPHTAKNWWKAKNLPDLVNATNLAKAAAPIAIALVQQMVSHGNVFGLLGELHRIADLESSHDPRFAIEYNAFMQRLALGNGH